MVQLRHYRYLMVLCFLLSALFINVNFDKSYAATDWVAGELSALGQHQQQLTTYAHNYTIQTMMLSPQAGIVVGIGTTAFLPCPVPEYLNGSFELHSGTETYPTTLVQNEELQGGPLIVAYFHVGEETWNGWKRNNPGILEVVDTVLNTRHFLPLQMDPALRNRPHLLSATTTFRKQYRLYRRDDSTIAGPWSDQEVMDRLVHWLDFHRKAGVNHFYLIDNEGDTSKPNLQISGNDITYIRAARMLYDSLCCYSDGHTPGKQTFTVVGQLMLENSILRLAHTEWLVVGDLDEFFDAGNQFDRLLSRLIEHFQHFSCLGEKPIDCTPLHETMFQQVFCLNFLPQIMSATNERLFEVIYRFKPIVRPRLTSTISVHYSLPFNKSHSTKAAIPPGRGWLAHYNKKAGVGNLNWTRLLSNIHNHSSALRLE